MADFKQAQHTIVVSDIHLADAEPPHPKNPLWKRFKRPKLFIDRTFKKFLEYLSAEISSPIELVFNGDIFDFDSVMVLPEDPRIHVNWLERKRGLASEEAKSRFKIKVILNDHKIWVDSMREFIQKGNRVAFVIGNHDMELHWPSVQKDIIASFELTEEFQKNVRFCEWFYLSNQDTLIEHGNQYDAYCVCSNPMHPLIKRGSRISVRLPFGNLAGKFMTNGMGLFNPHVESSFIMSFKEYVIFFFKYIIRTQPLIIWTWFWGASVTLIVSLSEGLKPALRDPLTVESRVDDIAEKSNATPRIVRSLRALHVHPAIFNPMQILKELWLDRALLLFGIFVGCFFVFSSLNVIMPVSYWWFFGPLAAILPMFLFYARNVESDVFKVQRAIIQRVRLSSQIANVNRLIHGHTHREGHHWMEGVEVVNTGTWSPAYEDVECTKPYGKKCFAWIKPDFTSSESKRIVELYEWKDPGVEKLPVSEVLWKSEVGTIDLED